MQSQLSGVYRERNEACYNADSKTFPKKVPAPEDFVRGDRIQSLRYVAHLKCTPLDLQPRILVQIQYTSSPIP